MVDSDPDQLKSYISKSKEKFVYQLQPGSSVFFRVPIESVLEKPKKKAIKDSSNRKKAIVVVLGDIGRSPRMCYHAYSLATQADHDVSLVGYLDSAPHSKIVNNEHIRVVPVPPPPPAFNTLPEYAQMFLKLIWTLFSLLSTLLFRTSWSCDILLMQNPPAIPTSFVCWLTARLKGSLFVIDWHNYMFTVLRDKYKLTNLSFDPPENLPEAQEVVKEKEKIILKRRDKGVSIQIKKKKDKPDKKENLKTFRHKYVELVYTLEGFFGRRADGGLCVTKAMQKNLLTIWNIPSAVLYDRPPSWTFGNTTDEEKHDLFMRLGRQYPIFGANDELNSNSFTELVDGKVVWKDDRPMIVMSSTSWTIDEDFSILFEATRMYNEIARLIIGGAVQNRLPTILLVITGKGPMKEYYLDTVARLNMGEVKVLTPWLEAADYPKMLAAADIGVSLHTSTSGLDLPMKVVDMFGSGVPVLAKSFACISELVEDKKNGFLFETSKDLSEQLISLATGFPNHCPGLHALKKNVTTEKLTTWEETWPNTVSAVLTAPRNLARERILAREPESESEVN